MKTTNEALLHSQIIVEVKRRLLEESVPRIKKCLNQLTVEEIWFRPNQETVSVGNLVLHLSGNVRQWILSGLGKEPDHRERDQEFAETGPIETRTLFINLDTLMEEVEQLLNRITPEMLTEKHRVQGNEETGIGILMHVVEHFSYHVGQITYFVKSRKNIDMKYYDGVNLNKK